MAPFIPRDSRVHVVPVNREHVRVGDVIAHLHTVRRVVAHRIVSIKHGKDGPIWITKGDAYGPTDHISPSAAFFIVSRVEAPWLSYNTNGPLGRLISFATVGAGRPGALFFRSVAFACRQIHRVYVHVIQ
ncbi:MAG: hypothetical protein QNJ97_02790 [Myxococcota bacterium]|nr:hypothetical protein [Myxococcota bacterium]